MCKSTVWLLQLLDFDFFFVGFCQQNLTIHVFWKTSALRSKGCGKGQQPQGCPGSSLLLTSVSKRCLHSLHTLFKREMVEALDAGQLDSSSTTPETRHLALVCVGLVCNRTAYLQGKYAWFTFLMLSYYELVFRMNTVLVLLREKIVLSNWRRDKKKEEKKVLQQ